MKLVATVALAAALFAAGPALAETRTIELPPFTAVSIASGINATITVGGTQSVEAEAPTADILNELKIRVVNGRLEAWVDWSIFDLFDFARDRQLYLRIAVPSVTALEASSGADVTATGVTGDTLSFEVSSGADLTASAVTGADYRLEVSSGAHLTIDGTCTKASIDISSGADIEASKLLCAEVDVDSSSGANAAVFAGVSLKGRRVERGRRHGSRQSADSRGRLKQRRRRRARPLKIAPEETAIAESRTFDLSGFDVVNATTGFQPQ